MKHFQLTSYAWSLRAVLVTLVLSLGGGTFAFNLQVIAAEVSMTSSTTITECPSFGDADADIAEAVCLVGESLFGSMGVDLAKSGIQLAAMKAGLSPFMGWTQEGASLRAAWANSTGSQGLVVMIHESGGAFAIALMRIEP